MPIVFPQIDVVLLVSRDNDSLPLVGFDSPSSDQVNQFTGKEMSGWKWDEKIWPLPEDLESEWVVPSIWDPDNTDQLDSNWQSGFGDNEELQYLGIEVEKHQWVPEIERGYYFDGRGEYYLYGDGGVEQILPDQTTGDGVGYIELDHTPKPGSPVRLTRWEWNSSQSRWEKAISLEKKTVFSGVRDEDGERLSTLDGAGEIIYDRIDTDLAEFLVQQTDDGSPPTLLLNNTYVSSQGGLGPVVDMEILGTSAGLEEEEYYTRYSPLLSSDLEVVSYFLPDSPRTWTPVTEFSGGEDLECVIDYNLGIVRFSDQWQLHPEEGEQVAIRYTTTLSVQYEAEDTTDHLTAHEVDLNPIGRADSRGFLLLRHGEAHPYSITLYTEDIDEIGEDQYSPVYLATPTKLIALVKDSKGDSVEGADVTFTLSGATGSFTSGSNTVTVRTDSSGRGRTTYNPPKNVRSVGYVLDTLSYDGDQTIFTLEASALSSRVGDWYLYKIFNDDPSLGIPDLGQYYTDFIADEGITGPTGEVGEDYENSWEHTHRIITGLLTPVEYNADIRNGKKQLVITWDEDAVNPHNYPWSEDLGTGAFVPLRPTNVRTTFPSIQVVYEGLLDEPGSEGNETLVGYFLVGPTVASVVATTRDLGTGSHHMITSNTVYLEVKVAPSMDGTPLIQTLNSLQRAALLGEEGPESGALPLGWRIRSSDGINLAACLDGLTYWDINRTVINTDDNSGRHTVGHAVIVR